MIPVYTAILRMSRARESPTHIYLVTSSQEGGRAAGSACVQRDVRSRQTAEGGSLCKPLSFHTQKSSEGVFQEEKAGKGRWKCGGRG